MSSFKRKGTSKPALPTYPGTRPSPGSTQTLITSTGISSLDDILGGGLPLSCSLVIAAQDIHSSYGELITKYFVAQGLVAGHKVCIIGDDDEKLGQFVRECMWLPKSLQTTMGADEDEDEKRSDQSQKVKIAWRYEKMKQFKTTVGSSSLYVVYLHDSFCHGYDLNLCRDGESYCQTFELSSRIPEEVVNDAIERDRLHFIDVSKLVSPSRVLEAVSRFVSSDTSAPVRICIPSLGSPAWGDLTAQVGDTGSDCNGIGIDASCKCLGYHVFSAFAESAPTRVWLWVRYHKFACQFIGAKRLVRKGRLGK